MVWVDMFNSFKGSRAYGGERKPAEIDKEEEIHLSTKEEIPRTKLPWENKRRRPSPCQNHLLPNHLSLSLKNQTGIPRRRRREPRLSRSSVRIMATMRSSLFFGQIAGAHVCTCQLLLRDRERKSTADLGSSMFNAWHIM